MRQVYQFAQVALIGTFIPFTYFT